jgi:DNA-binding transcriptional regulator/RsmH inhibitor MraZ
MDEPNVPEKKNSPIRSLIVGLSVFTAFIVGCVWVIEKEKWERLPADDSRRMLASEVAATFRRLFRSKARRDDRQ